jgi:hypothetical protein
MPEINETPMGDGAVTTETEETQQSILVDDVVSALTNPPSAEDGEVLDLREQLQRAADEYDKRTAEAFGRALVESLCEDPSDVRRLEALLILGLAHPSILELYQVSLANEGRRLCILLENQGELERARGLLEMLATRVPEDRDLQQDLSSMMRRCGDVTELVDRCLKRAEEAVEKGTPMDAIPWLQEVLLHDQSRRDVARMIRDLRYQEMEDETHSRKRTRLVGFLLLVSMLIGGFAVREYQINASYEALPVAEHNDRVSIDSRIDGIDQLVASNRLWVGMFNMVNERTELRLESERLAAKEAEQQRVRRAEASERSVKAEKLRLEAIDAVMGNHYDEAKELFVTALSLGAEDWPRRERIIANIAAIDDLLKGHK